ncbi:MAG: thioredoxin family protein, partial [Infirmifilum sp.]
MEELIKEVKELLGQHQPVLDYAPAGTPDEEELIQFFLKPLGVKLREVESMYKPMFAAGRARFYGVPRMNELVTLAGLIVDSNLGFEGADAVAKALQGVEARVLVFVTSPCPHCPYAARMALRVALASKGVITEIWSYDDFPDYASEWEVTAVPHTIVFTRDGTPIGALTGFSFSQYPRWLLDKLIA